MDSNLLTLLIKNFERKQSLIKYLCFYFRTRIETMTSTYTLIVLYL